MGKKYKFLSIPILVTAFLFLALFQSVSQAAQKTPQPGLPTEQQNPALQQLKVQRNRLHPELVKTLSTAESAGQIPVIIEWGGQSYEQILQAALLLLDEQKNTRLQERSLVVATLQAYASEQSRALRSTLQEAEQLGQASEIQSFWVSPIIAAKASPALIETLSKREDVVQIRPDERFYLEQTSFTPTGSEAGMSWNLELIGVGFTQQQLGLDGSGVVVANLDTGVDWQHPALLKKYRGYNPHGPAQHIGNWFVVTNEPYLVPGDSNGHGTHTMGTMVGDDEAGNRTGVAPGARWIAVKLFNNQGYTYESWIHAAFQWVIAPEGNPSLAPDIVNSSWGSDSGGDDRFRSDIVALRSAGILPVFSAGNNGPYPYTIGSPASYPESLSVGAVDQDKFTALFSSRGPSPWNEIKPDVTAPGVNIRSTFPGSGYATANGTSMAAPHVAGLAALILQGNPALSPDEIEEIIRSTAQPLGAAIPNNDTGWGLANAYAAGLKATSHGELAGVVRRVEDNSPVPFPVLSATPLANPALTLTSTGNANGAYTFALRPERYDLSISAFGFLSSTIHNIAILTGTQTTLDIMLPAAPSGLIHGKVTDLQSGLPLSATLTVEGTPVRVQTDPATGLYNLNLPEGSWNFNFYSAAHRTGHITPTITAGGSYTVNIGLLPAPMILLVDGGRWYNGSQIGFFKEALDALDFPYNEWPIRSLGLGGTTDERPILGDFDSYDAVIWSDPSSSPGWIGSNDVITDFLKAGGHLLISGEDTLYLDGGGSIWSLPAPYMIRDIGIQFKGEGNLSPLSGTQGSFLDGLHIILNTPDSSQQQLLPDEAQIRSPLIAQTALTWPDQTVGGVASGVCQPYRAFWTGFGFEGTGPRNNRIELMERVLKWFDQPPEPYGIKIFSSPETMLGTPGSVLTQTIQLNSTGVLTDHYNLHVAGGPWPLDIELPDGKHVQGDTSLSLGACQRATITATITIPPDQPRDARALYSLSFTSQNDPTIVNTLSLAAKTYSPVLLVEHQIWYKDIEPYTKTLNSLGIPYDIYQTQPSLRTPSINTLQNYPIVIWTTGYNWYNPLGSDGEKQLSQYLDQGGRLLVSSQDLLDVSGLSSFVQERLGVIGFTLSVTPTEVTGAQDLPRAQDLPFNADLGLWDLSYSYPNWGDGLKPSENTAVILEDQNPFPVGVAHTENNWRSSFFSFPLETLDDAAHHILLSQVLLWISPFGESRLAAPPAAVSGGQIPITLTLQLANNQAMFGLRAELPLLPQTSLVKGSLQGPWKFEPSNNSLVWEGDLSPGEIITLSGVLQLAQNLPAKSNLPIKANLYDSKGLVIVAETPVQIEVPWLRLLGDFNPKEAEMGETTVYTLELRNDGVISSSTFLTVTIPTGISLISDTLTATQGIISTRASTIQWSGEIPPQSGVFIGYSARINPAHPGIRLATSALAADLYSRKKAWFVVRVPARYYFPFIMR